MKMRVRKFNQLWCIMLLLFAMAGESVQAQQKPHYTQYVLNNYILNPALSGIENYTDVKLSHRHQWVGLQDAPVTTYFTIHAPIGKKDYKTSATSFRVPGENPLGKQYWQDYEAAAPHHGIGLQVINDKFGPFSTTTVQATYAYHIGLNATTNLSGGFGIGGNSTTLNSKGLFFGPDFPVDPAVTSSGNLGNINLDLSAGLWLYSANYFFGISAQQLLPGKLDFSNNAVGVGTGKMVPHYFATGGFRFLVGDDFNIVPSVVAKKVGTIPLQVDLNAKVQYRDVVWMGVSSRVAEGFAGFLGVNVLNGITVSYAYDYSTTKIRTVSRGTHEILIGFILGNKFSNETCPRNVW